MPLLVRVWCLRCFQSLLVYGTFVAHVAAAPIPEGMALPGASPQIGIVPDSSLALFVVTTLIALIVYIWRRAIKDVDAFRPYVDTRINALSEDMHAQQLEFMARLAHIDQSQEENLRREQYAHKEWIRAYEDMQRQLATIMARIDRLLERG